jgi:hypothetical protein
VVFVLHAKQPLTTDPAAAVGWPDCAVVLLTDAGTGSPVREDVLPLPHEVHRVAAVDWPEVIPRLAGDRPLDVVTNDEYCLLTCQDLRAGLGLPPRHPVGLIHYLDKVLMKQRLAAHGVDTPRFLQFDRVVADDSAAERVVAELGLPVVAKPRQEANSRGVAVLHSLDDIRRWQQRRAGAPGWHVEELVAGTQGHVNGIVQGEAVTPVQVGEYLGPLLGLPAGRRLGGVLLPGDHPLVAPAHRLNEAVVAALGGGSFVVHTEFVARPDGRLTVLEVAARAPGAMVSEAARKAAGVNLETANLALQLGAESVEVRPTGVRAGWVWVPVMPGETFRDGPAFDSAALVHVRAAARAGNTGRSGVLGASVLVWSADNDQLARDIERALTWDWTRADGSGRL